MVNCLKKLVLLYLYLHSKDLYLWSNCILTWGKVQRYFDENFNHHIKYFQNQFPIVTWNQNQQLSKNPNPLKGTSSYCAVSPQRLISHIMKLFQAQRLNSIWYIFLSIVQNASFPSSTCFILKVLSVVAFDWLLILIQCHIYK